MDERSRYAEDTGVIANYYRASDPDAVGDLYSALEDSPHFRGSEDYDFFTYDGGRVAFLPEAGVVALVRELGVESTASEPDFQLEERFEYVRTVLDDIERFTL
ncbi:MAG: hypothetical protein SVQ76_01170 [Candidatus Nanohaloarchaea archaeon]|nr:hypothetical protein [Candidatus Nanohaloarchaea archaeon]